MIADKLYKQSDLVITCGVDKISLRVLGNGFFSVEKVRKTIMQNIRKHENDDYTDFIFDLNKKIYNRMYLGHNNFLIFELTKDTEQWDLEKGNHDDCKSVIVLNISKFDYSVSVLTYTMNLHYETVFDFYHQD